MLKGLEATKKYKIKEINVFPGTVSSIDENKVYSGDFLMTVGISPQLSGKRTSVVIEINEIK